MKSTEQSITGFFHRVCGGDARAAEHIWEFYLPRLTGIARQRLAGSRLVVSDVDDVLQSAFICFWNRARSDGLASDFDRDDLWNLLGKITKEKAIEHWRREHARKRDRDLLQNDVDLEQLQSAAWTTTSAAMFDLYSSELLGQLDDNHQSVALLKLYGHTVAEIAQIQGCVDRTVLRKLEFIRKKWSRELQA